LRPLRKSKACHGLDCNASVALLFPRGTAGLTLHRLEKAASEALDSPPVRERLKSVGITVVTPERRSTEYLRKLIPAEIAKWSGPIKASGVTIE